jgi:pyruvate/2-oxoglutarate dehydrogenase complex dihydrolipoamide dehydrogenase (E3) component
MQLQKLGVNVKLNTKITKDSAELSDADKIIIALGATPLIPPIPGIDKSNVLEVSEVHLGNRDGLGKKVVVAGGGLSGCDCAIELAESGKEVTIVEMLDKIVPKAMLAISISVHDKVKECGIDVRTGCKVLAITDGGVKVESANGVAELEADTVILAFGMRPNRSEAKEIFDAYPNAISIGDCVEVGQIGEAVRGAYFGAWGIV